MTLQEYCEKYLQNVEWKHQGNALLDEQGAPVILAILLAQWRSQRAFSFRSKRAAGWLSLLLRLVFYAFWGAVCYPGKLPGHRVNAQMSVMKLPLKWLS